MQVIELLDVDVRRLATWLDDDFDSGAKVEHGMEQARDPSAPSVF